eukprot:5495875-Pyramimonas_sp.AAC.1
MAKFGVAWRRREVRRCDARRGLAGALALAAPRRGSFPGITTSAATTMAGSFALGARAATLVAKGAEA